MQETWSSIPPGLKNPLEKKWQPPPLFFLGNPWTDEPVGCPVHWVWEVGHDSSNQEQQQSTPGPGMLFTGSTTPTGHTIHKSPNTSLWLSVVRWEEGESPVITSQIIKQIFLVVFHRSFSQILRGTPKVVPLLVSPTCTTSPFLTSWEFQRIDQRIMKLNWWEDLVSELEAWRAKTRPSRRPGDRAT